MKLVVEFVGNLVEIAAGWNETLARASSSAMKKATQGLQNDLRSTIESVGLGHRLANTIRSRTYPEAGNSADAAGYVWSKAPLILNAFTKGAIIHSKHGRFLAIPTDLVRSTNGRTMKPLDFAANGIELRFVPPAGSRRFGMLVMDNARINSRGKAVEASKTAAAMGKTATAVMFILVPEVTLKSRFAAQPLLQKWISELPAMIEEGIAHE